MHPEIENAEKYFNFFRTSTRMMIEVFTRKNFGHRYHRIRVLLIIEFMLFIIPELSYRYWPGYEFRKFRYSFWDVYWTWYVFMVAFFVVSCYHIFVRLKNRKTLEAQLKTSHWWGDVHPVFNKINLPKKQARKIIAIVIEPLIFIILGRILLWFDQKLGWLFIVSGITFAIDSYIKLNQFDTYMEDLKDEQIIGQVVKEHVSQPFIPGEAAIPIAKKSESNNPGTGKNGSKNGRAR